MTDAPVDRENLREAIISASLQIGSELGEEGLTMRGLAGRLGVSPTALYQHFEGKTAILQEIRLRGATQLLDGALSAFELDSPREILTEASRRYVRFARENPWLYRVLFESGSAPPHEQLAEGQRTRLREIERRLAERNKDVFTKLAMQGDDVLPTALASWWASLHGVCSLLLGRHLNPDSPLVPIVDMDAFVEQHIEHLVAGLLTRAGL